MISSQLRAALFQISPRAKWGDKAKKAAQVLQSFSLIVDPGAGTPTLSLDVSPAGGLADQGDLTLDLTDVLVSIGEAAQFHKIGLVLLFDEVQFLSRTHLEGLIQAMHKTVQRKLPVTFVGAGLPRIAELAGDAKSSAERLLGFPEIDSLDFDDATDAYEAKLDSSFFHVRLDRATPLQIACMRALAGLGPESQKAADVAAVMGRESTQLAPTRSELINTGVPCTPTHGCAGFTVPPFDRFMLRAVRNLDVPQGRKKAAKRSQ